MTTTPEPAKRRRASSARRGLAQAAAPATHRAASEPAPAQTDQPAAAPQVRPRIDNGRVEHKVKYSLILGIDEAEMSDDLVKRARRTLARNVDKSMVIRALIALAADDASLRDQVIAEVGRREA